jgi:ABC-type lipoprotein release transport system permease subunit
MVGFGLLRRSARTLAKRPGFTAFAVAVTALLTIVCLAACLAPALRAATTDPMSALRGE